MIEILCKNKGITEEYENLERIKDIISTIFGQTVCNYSAELIFTNNSLYEELLFDLRINREKLKTKKERLNRSLGKWIDNDLLLDKYKDIKICYIRKNAGDLTLIHEVLHLKFGSVDAISTNWKKKLSAEKEYWDFKKFLRFNTEILLDEFLTEKRTISAYLRLRDENYEIILNQNDFLITQIAGLLISLEFYLKNYSRKSLTIDVQFEISDFILRNYMQNMMYFLGRMYGFLEINEVKELLEEAWNNKLHQTLNNPNFICLNQFWLDMKELLWGCDDLPEDLLIERLTNTISNLFFKELPKILHRFGFH